MKRDKYSYVFFWEDNFWGKVPAFLKSHTGRAKNHQKQIIIVSVFICTFKLTALLEKNFHLLLHCYTLQNRENIWKYKKYP